MVGDRRLRADPPARAQLAVHRRPVPVGPDARSGLVHVARGRDPRGRPRVDRRRLGSRQPLLGRLPGDGAARGSAPAAGGGHQHLQLQRVPDARDPDPHRPRSRGGRVPEQAGSVDRAPHDARDGRLVPHHALRRLPRQHHGVVPAQPHRGVRRRRPDVVGSPRRDLPHRDGGRLHASHDLRPLRLVPARRLGDAPRHEPFPVRLGDAIGRSSVAVHRVGDGRGPCALGRRDLGSGWPRAAEGRRAPAALHGSVLPPAPHRVGDLDATGDHVPADPDRDRRHRHGVETDPDSGLAVRAGLDLVDVPVRRRPHVPPGPADPVLPLHERDRRADGAQRPGSVRRRSLALPRRRLEEDRRRGRRARRGGRARVGLHRSRDQPVGAAGQPVGSPERAHVSGGHPGGGGRRR